MKLLLVGLLALVPLMAQDKEPTRPESRNVTAEASHGKETKTSPLRMGDSSAAARREGIKQAQQSLNDKGFDCGPADGVLGPRTRAGIRQYQESENLPVTGRLDVETAGKLGVGPKSITGNFEGAGQDVAQGSKELGHEVKQGKPVAAGKEFGKGIARAAQKIGEGVVDAVSPDSDRGDREEKREEGR